MNISPGNYCNRCHAASCLTARPADEVWFNENEHRIPWKPPPTLESLEGEKAPASANFERISNLVYKEPLP